MTVGERYNALAVWALVFALAARVIMLPLLPVTDSTEGRYAQIAQEMTISGDWITPRVWFNGAHIPFMGKPPLFFWLAAGAMRLFGINAFSARLPSFLAALFTLAILYYVMRRYGNGNGLLSVLITASCGFFLAIGGAVATDMVLTACVAGSLLAYFAFLREPDRKIRHPWSLLVFLLLALGFLTKGPVTLILFGLPVFVWTLRWRQWQSLRDHRWLIGGVLFLALTLPWFLLCEHRNPGFLKYFFINENLLRFVTHHYGDAYGSGHLQPRGMAALLFFAAAAPWSLVAVWLVIRNRFDRREPTSPDKQTGFFFLCFALGTAFWCLARQLLITYTLPFVPLFAGWLALHIKTEKARYNVTRACSFLLIAYGGLSLTLPFFLRSVATTEPIIQQAQRYRTTHAPQAPLLFDRETPYSALFYGRGWVIPHPLESLDQTLAQWQGYTNTLLVVTHQPPNRRGPPPLDMGNPLACSGPWTLFLVPPKGLRKKAPVDGPLK